MRSIYISLISIIVVLSLCISASAATIDGVYTYYKLFIPPNSDYQGFSVGISNANTSTKYVVGMFSTLTKSDNTIYSHMSYNYIPMPATQNLKVNDPLYDNVVCTYAWGQGTTGSMAFVNVLFLPESDIPVKDSYISADFRVNTVLPKDYEFNSNNFTLKVNDVSSDRVLLEIKPQIVDIVIKSIPNYPDSKYYSFNLKYYFTVYKDSSPNITGVSLSYPFKYSTTQNNDAYNITYTSFDDLTLTFISAADYEEIQKGQAAFEPIINIYTQQTPEDLEQIDQGKQQGDKLSGEMDKLDEANKKLEEALGDNYVEDPTELIEKPAIFDDQSFNDNISVLTNSIWDDAIITPMFGIVSGLSILSYVLFGKKDK